MLKKCRICNNPDLISCVNLGEQYLSSIFPDSLNYRHKLKKYPLELKLCIKGNSEKNCGVLQLDSQPDLSEMYKIYPYTSSSNEYMRQALKEVAKEGKILSCLNRGDLILDIGGNDGTLLSFFAGNGFELLNIDPAENIEPVFAGAKFIKSPFSCEMVEANVSKKAKLIFSIAMFYHIIDPVSFCRDIFECLDDEGIWIIQMAYLPSMLKTNMYDNIVHEHIYYYTISVLQWILGKAGLEIFNVSLNDIYGGSFRIFVRKKDFLKTIYIGNQRLLSLIEQEDLFNLFDIKTYQDFNNRIQKTKDDLLQLLTKLKSENKKIWAYGASTKGNTILQYCGIDSQLVEAVADVNPFKIGKYMIGTDIPIKDESAMRKVKPDYLLILPYGFAVDFAKRESELIRNGTKLIVPLPEVKIL